MTTLNLDAAIEKIYKGEILPELLIKETCDKLKELMIYQSNVQIVSSPITVVGDIQGYSVAYLYLA